jgi:heme exporter protein B
VSLARETVTIAAKDLRIELRGRYALSSVLPFAATMLVALGLSLGPGRGLLREVAPGLLWMAALFAAVLLVRRSYEAESEDGAMEGLLLAPVDRAAVFLGKAGAVVLQLLVLEAALLLLVGALFDLSPAGEPLVLAAALLLGSVGLGALGTLFGALTESPRAREAILPLLVLPLATPVIVAAVKATALATGHRGGEAGSWLGLLLAFDVAFVSAGVLVFGYLLED